MILSYPPIIGSLVLLGLILSVLMGLKVIRAGVRIHAVTASLTLLFALPHAVRGWLYVVRFHEGVHPPQVVGTLVVLGLLVNMLIGNGKIQASVPVHRALGIVTLLLGLLHGIGGMRHFLFR